MEMIWALRDEFLPTGRIDNSVSSLNFLGVSVVKYINGRVSIASGAATSRALELGYNDYDSSVLIPVSVVNGGTCVFSFLHKMTAPIAWGSGVNNRAIIASLTMNGDPILLRIDQNGNLYLTAAGVNENLGAVGVPYDYTNFEIMADSGTGDVAVYVNNGLVGTVNLPSGDISEVSFQHNWVKYNNNGYTSRADHLGYFDCAYVLAGELGTGTYPDRMGFLRIINAPYASEVSTSFSPNPPEKTNLQIVNEYNLDGLEYVESPPLDGDDLYKIDTSALPESATIVGVMPVVYGKTMAIGQMDFKSVVKLDGQKTEKDISLPLFEPKSVSPNAIGLDPKGNPWTKESLTSAEFGYGVRFDE